LQVAVGDGFAKCVMGSSAKLSDSLGVGDDGAARASEEGRGIASPRSLLFTEARRRCAIVQ
jgi:hypothetical protein